MKGRTSLALTIMFLLTACGGEAWTEVGASSSGPKPVLANSAGAAGGGAAIVAKDLAFEPTQLTVAAGDVNLTLTNRGMVFHTLVFDSAEFGKLETGQGEAATATMNLPPGTYGFYCDQPGHRGAGMEGTLVVT